MSREARHALTEEQPAVARPRPRAVRTAPRRLLADRVARWVVTAGGMAIILSVLGILVFILVEVSPLLGGARLAPGREVPLPGPAPLALAGDEYRSHVVTLGADGTARVVRTADGELLFEKPALPSAAGASEPAFLHVDAPPGDDLFTASTQDGRVILVPVDFETSFSGSDRIVTPRIEAPVVFAMDPAGRPIEVYAARQNADSGSTLVVARIGDGRLAAVRRSARRNLLTDEIEESAESHSTRAPEGLTHLLLDHDQRNLFGGTADGRLFRWPIEEGRPGEPEVVSAGSAAITALNFLIGDRSLVVGQADGALSIWFPVRQVDQSFRLTRIRDFRRHPGPIRLLAPSSRDKGFLAQDESGRLGLYYSTSHRTLWNGSSPLREATAVLYAPKGDGAFLAGPGRLVPIHIGNPHPETSLRSLFGRVWYEGSERAEFVWQSTGGTDDFEPKLSLTPLLVGTLKGTVFSLILAIPLGVLGAMYTSQFMHPDLKRFVKPVVEIMAALPSVVLGFLAGLWLAPRLERVFPGLLLMIVVLPLVVLAAGFLWRATPRRFRGRVPTGAEAAGYVLVLALGIWFCLALSRSFEVQVFGGNFQGWLLETTGLNYDQRNAIVVGIAMGFAVIPIIFAIAEDAFSNVPRNLVSGSLALGANRWQTVTRVVLPTASPGIFSAIMVGFGRAVGETMIVLMATGNTPILDWNPFNGFRTLSANIAVEIPEAPHNSTLFRTLFLAALLLFVLTFLVNTVAELVRQRLRRRYAEL